MNLGFIGGGVMAEAIISGVRKTELDIQVTVADPDGGRRNALEKIGLATTEDNAIAVESADIVILAIKPQHLDSVVPGLKATLQPQQTLLSILAGVKMHSIGLRLNHDRLIRVMPNTPVQIGHGMSVWTATREVPRDIKEFTGKALSTLGDQIFVDQEKYVDLATALSASGPAYVFKFIEAMIDAGVLLGMPAGMARRLVLQTVMGSGMLVRESEKHPAELSNTVTSPGGTTAAALRALQNGRFQATVINAVVAAYERGEELSGGK